MNKRTDFQIDLEKIEREISELGGCALPAPIDTEKATRYVARLYQHASLTGDLQELEVAEEAIDSAIRQIGPWPDLYMLKAQLDFKLHRPAEAARDLSTIPGLGSTLQGRALRADIDSQEGRYGEARKAYQALIRDDRAWDNLARLAYLESKLGDVELAEELYVEAEDEITAKEMRAFAWVELQRGVLDLRHGRHEEAGAHYRRAGQAYSGYWLVDEHVAELLGAQGKLDEAVALYHDVIARVARPELQQALGELYLLMDQPEQARLCHEKALTAYLESARRGHVHYYHHLADFYSDVLQDGPEAVKWARKDAELRWNFSTQAALAWACYREGRFTEALATVNQALASGASDAHLFFQAGMIHRANGRSVEADRYLEMADVVNRHHQRFHVHR